MKTDKHVHKIFNTAPGLFFDLLDITTKSDYSMTSVSVKDTVRTMDALFKPADSSEIHYVVEFQFQPSKNILARTFTEVASLSASNTDLVYNGIVIFLNEKMAGESKPWSDICKMEGSGFQIFYLDKLLENLKKRSPNHPVIALFAPLMEKDEEALAKNANTYYNRVKDFGFQPKDYKKLEAVLIDWFIIRFTKKTREEILAMFALERSIENSVAYQDIIKIGKIEGKTEGEKIGEIRGKEIGKEIGVVVGRIEDIKELYADGIITDSVFRKREKKYQRQLTELQKKYGQS